MVRPMQTLEFCCLKACRLRYFAATLNIYIYGIAAALLFVSRLTTDLAGYPV
jgi:hypothetical protein